MHSHPHQAGPKILSWWNVQKNVANAGLCTLSSVVEKWGKWGLKEYIWKGSFLCWFVGLVVPVQEIFFPGLAALVAPVQNIFSSSYTILLLLHLHEETNEPTKEGPLSYVLQESPFASVSAVSSGHSSLVLSGCPVYSLVLILYFLLICLANVKI